MSWANIAKLEAFAVELLPPGLSAEIPPTFQLLTLLLKLPRFLQD